MAKTFGGKRAGVNFSERTLKALLLAMEITGETQTEATNRAVQLYSYIMFETKRQGGELILKDANGKHSTMKIL